jgi:hypothetical protein
MTTTHAPVVHTVPLDPAELAQIDACQFGIDAPEITSWTRPGDPHGATANPRRDGCG